MMDGLRQVELIHLEYETRVLVRELGGKCIRLRGRPGYVNITLPVNDMGTTVKHEHQTWPQAWKRAKACEKRLQSKGQKKRSRNE